MTVKTFVPESDASAFFTFTPVGICGPIIAAGWDDEGADGSDRKLPNPLL